MELADQQVTENEGSGGLTGAEIPAAADVPAHSPAPAEKPAKDAKPPTIREALNKSIAEARVEEAKRARAADGKFTKLESGAAEVSQERTGKPATAEIQPEKKDVQPEPASKPFAPPPGFSAETKAFLATLPADHPIKRDLEKRETEVSTGFKQYSDKAKQYDAIEQIIAPVRQTFQQAGLASDADAIKALLGWEAGFRNPATRNQAFADLARAYSFDISTLVPSSSSGSPSAAQDIPDQFRPVYQQVGQVDQRVQNVEAQLQTLAQQQAARELTAFASDPRHSHYEAVRATMGDLIGKGMVPPHDLEGAYQMAIKIHPEVSAKIAEEERQKAAEKAAAEHAEKLRKAQAAAVSPATRPPLGASGSNPPGKKAGVRESILSSISALREEQRA